jgi:putative DNA primase/helicase
MSIAGELLDRALALAKVGLPVFPCTANKSPVKGSGGFQDATRDSNRVQNLFRQYRGALLGVPTGEVSGIDVLDIDSFEHPEAGEWLMQWEPIGTRAHRTRSGGSHFLFLHEPRLCCQQSYPVAGVDVRADGGCDLP